MANIFGSPGRYIQGAGALGEIATHAGKFGKKFFVLISESGRKRSGATIDASVQKAGFSVQYDIFNGECSKKEIKRVEDAFKASGCDLIIGVGGGKILDTAKAAAMYAKVPVVIAPTVASTDAPCSALSVIYTDDGVVDSYLFLQESPNIVLVDTKVVAAAPVRLIVSGMGDALSTYFEARACVRSHSNNFIGGITTNAAFALAELCYKTLLKDGLTAKLACQAHALTPAVEHIIEANTLLSGLGFESVGIAAAHAVHNGMTSMEETHKFYHGEKVAFGTLTQLVLEDAQDDIDTVYGFCESVGLPTTFADLNIANPDPARILEVAKLACAPSDTMGCLPFPVTPEIVRDAMFGADAIGRARKSK
jgi:glycerol dehydrogenase